MRFVNISLILLAYFGVGMACKFNHVWVNEKGSNLTIVVDDQGAVSGTFKTAVESKPGAAGGGLQQEAVHTFGNPFLLLLEELLGRLFAIKSRHFNGGGRPIIGWADSTTNLISFAVMFKESTVVFTGQCYTKSDGTDLLWTSWILKSKADSCKDHWMKNTIGEDRFTRRSAKQRPTGPCGS